MKILIFIEPFFQIPVFFRTLDNPEVRHYGYDSGWSESLKHSGINDGFHPEIETSERYIDFLERNLQGIVNMDEEVIRHCMLRNAIIKGSIVEIDEKEQGCRVGLNFGHTFGHALETYMNNLYLQRDPSGATVFPHGDAVGIGAHFACWVSIMMGTGLEMDDLSRQVNLYNSLGIMTKVPREAATAFESVYDIMGADKKAINGVPQFVLQEDIGKLKQTRENQPNGDPAPGGYFLQPVEKDVLKEAFDCVSN